MNDTFTMQGLTTMTRTAGKVTFVKLPRELWRVIDGGCSCQHCQPTHARPMVTAYWDTLVIPHADGAKTYTCHYPEL